MDNKTQNKTKQSSTENTPLVGHAVYQLWAVDINGKTYTDESKHGLINQVKAAVFNG